MASWSFSGQAMAANEFRPMTALSLINSAAWAASIILNMADSSVSQELRAVSGRAEQSLQV